MTHHGNTSGQDSLNRFSNFGAALKFDGVAAGFLHDADGGFKRLTRVPLVGSKRHVNDQQGAVHGSLNALSVVDHVVEGHGHRGDLTGHDVGRGVPYEDDVNTCLVDKAGKGVIVSRQHGDFFTRPLHFLKGVGGDLLRLAVDGHGASTAPGVFNASLRLFFFTGVAKEVRSQFMDGFLGRGARQQLLA